MAKYIDVESLVIGYSGHTPDDEFSKGVDFVLDLLDSKPPADVRHVVRGRWILDSDPGEPWKYKCDQCGEVSNNTCMGKPRYNYCPMCGADMRGGDAL